MTSSNEKEHVAVLGLGNMGSAVAESLLTNGHPVAIWNRNPARCKRLTGAGARAGGSAANACARASVAVVCVSDYDACMAILRSDGMQEALHGRTVIQLTTLTAAESLALHSWTRERGADCLDGAILGYPSDVRAAATRIIFSGPRAAFDRHRDVIEALSRSAIFISEKPGTAFLADKVIYAQYYGIVFAYLHASALAASAGVSLADFRGLTCGDERWLAKGRHIEELLDMVERGGYADTECSLEVHAAAYAHIVRMSREFGVEADFPALVARTMSRSIERGHGNDGLAAIFEALVADAGAHDDGAT